MFNEAGKTINTLISMHLTGIKNKHKYNKNQWS